MTVPLSAYTEVYGSLTGSLETPSYFEGFGSISGDLTILDDGFCSPETGGQLMVGGDFTLDPLAAVGFHFNGLIPDVGFSRMTVTGAVDLSGDLYLSGYNLVDGDSLVLINNDGVDPIVGTFDGYPEGAGIPIGDGLAALVSYVGGDGNDFEISIITDTFSADLELTVDAPLGVDLGDTMVIIYTITSAGPGDVTDGELIITLPGNATFVSSSPVGTINTGVLTIPLPSLTGIDSTTATHTLTAPAIESTVFVEAEVDSTTPELESFNNFAPVSLPSLREDVLPPTISPSTSPPKPFT